MDFELIKWQEEHARDFYMQSNDEALYKNMSDGFPKTLAECEAAVKGFSESDESNSCLRAIQVDGQIAGCIGAFVDSDIYCKNAELAYWLGDEYRGQGIMAEVIKQFTADIFRRYDVVRIYARPFDYNGGSQKVLEKAGFVCEGTLRSSVFKNGRMHDAKLYSKVQL